MIDLEIVKARIQNEEDFFLIATLIRNHKNLKSAMKCKYCKIIIEVLKERGLN